MSDEPKISVIVPIYNAELSLPKCLDSLLLQTFADFELLLIDDGSSDCSGNICDQYAERDPRIRVFHKANAGVSSARQVGIENAIGTFSIHVDSDDWVERNMLEQMSKEAIDHNADIVIADFYVDAETSIYYKQKPAILNGDEIICDILCGKLHGNTWNKLVRHRLYKDCNINFPFDINYCEDVLVVTQLLLHAKTIKYLPKAYYHYVNNACSITHALSKEIFRQRESFILQLKEMLTTLPFRKAIQQNIVYIKVDAYRSRLFTLGELAKMFPENRFPIFKSSFKFRIKVLLFLTSCRLPSLAALLTRERDYI